MSAVDYYNGVIIGSAQGSTWLFNDGTISAGDVSAVVTHNLGVSPTGYSVTAKDDYARGAKVTAVSSTTITVAITDPQGADATFKVGVSA